MRALLVLLALANLAVASPPAGACTLHGRVRVVTGRADYLVKVVRSFADIRVRRVVSQPSKPGEWLFVTSSADFTIRYVDSGEDIRVQYVGSWPGCPQ